MGNSFKINFIKHDNSYEFSDIEEDVNLDSKDKNVIMLGIDNIRGILNNDELKIKKYSQDEDTDNIVLYVNNETILELLEVYKKSKPYLSDEDLIKEIKKELLIGFMNISKVETNYIEDICEYTLKYKPNILINGNSSENTNAETEASIKEIDVSKINPVEVVAKIKEKVIAQDETVKSIVYNIYNNQKILESGNTDIMASKANILLDGPTGTGKTFILKEVANELSLPINITAADQYAVPGYKGMQLQEMLIPLLEQTGGNVELAERGVIVLDEFDKLCVNSEKSLEMHKAVQNQLLTYIGGKKVSLEYNGKKIDFDTSKITFICLGAFTDLREQKIDEELNDNSEYTIKPEDYIEAGLQRELVGRFSLITSTKGLTEDDFVDILKESKTSPLKQLVEAIKGSYDMDISYDDEVVRRVAHEAQKFNTGARALQTVVNIVREKLLCKIFESKSLGVNEITITNEDLDALEETFKRKATEAEKEKAARNRSKNKKDNITSLADYIASKYTSDEEPETESVQKRRAA